MAGLLSLMGGNRAQAPGQSMNPLQQLLDPTVALPMAAALMGNQGNSANFGNAFAAAGQGLSQRKQLQAQTAQKNQTLDYFRKSAPEFAQMVEAGMPMKEAWGAYLESRKAQQPTSGIREYEYARGQGYQGSFQDFQQDLKKAGATTVNVGGGAPGLGKLSTDYGYVMDPQTGQPVIDPATGLPKASAIPGSPAAMEQENVARARQAQKEMKSRTGNVVLEDIQRAKQIINNDGMIGSTGLIGGALQNVPGTDAYALQSKLKTIKANAGFDKLQQMRDASPTGGALGQVSEREIAFLQAAIGDLEQSQDKESLLYNLDRVERIYDEIINGPSDRRESSSQGWQDLGSGVRIRRMD